MFSVIHLFYVYAGATWLDWPITTLEDVVFIGIGQLTMLSWDIIAAIRSSKGKQ